MLDDGRTIGIALSGGGFRAALFGLGSLWRLNDAGLLARLDRVTSVSGGSILAGVLAHGWRALHFDASGRADNLEAVLAQPVRQFCARTIDISAGLWGALTPFRSAADFLCDQYAKHLFGDTMLKDLPLPEAGKAPAFVFYATNMQTGRSFRLRPDYLADWVLGRSFSTPVALATAVTASSAFPPVFSPVIVSSDPAAWQDGQQDLPDLDELRRRIVLADGGVYDNMGLEALVDRVDVSLVSDAGAPFRIEESPPEDFAFQLGRVRDILIDQTRALRKRWLVAEYRAGRKQGAYWGIGTHIADYQLPDAMAADNALTASLEAIPTRLSRFSEADQGHLVNWGYALADAALRRHAGLTCPSPAWPDPRYPLA